MAVTVSGLVSGLDTSSIIQQLMEVQQQPLTNLQNEEAQDEAQLTTYGNLQSTLSDLQTATEALTDSSNYMTYSASSSDDSVVTATTGDGAVAGTHQINVQQLAQNQKLLSTAFSPTEAVGAGTLELQVGSGAVTDITVSSTDTIQDVANAINSANAGVNANVIFDGTNDYLSLESADTGVDNTIQTSVIESGTSAGDAANTDMTGLSRLVYQTSGTQNLTQTQAAQDSIISVDGVSSIQNDSNTISDAISGVTLNLQGVSSSSSSNTDVTVAADTASGESAIQKFVTAYNNYVSFLSQNDSYDSSTGTAGSLLGDSTTLQINNQIQGVVDDMMSGNTGGLNLSDLGITIDQNGDMNLDTSTLSSALASNPQSVMQFFEGDGDTSQGFATELSTTLSGILDSSTGLLTARTQGIQSSITSLKSEISDMQTRLQQVQTDYESQFNAMEITLAQYQQTSSFLTAQSAALDASSSSSSGSSSSSSSSSSTSSSSGSSSS